MSIVSTKIHTNELSKDATRRTVRFLLTDHLGGTHLTGNRKVPEGSDISALMTQAASREEASLAKAEAQDSIHKIESGEDALTILNTLEHSTKKETAKVLVRWAMKVEDVYALLSLKPAIEDLKARLSGAQIADFLDITSDQLIRFNTRYNKVIANETDLNSVKEGEVFK